ncbi:MAG: hypothetical protein GF313_04465 [Caldithrix sp.]|nr:hypothetical protein [Caldithrix sp.]
MKTIRLRSIVHIMVLITVSLGQLSSQNIESQGEKMLLGSVSEGQLYKTFPDWKIEKDFYLVDSSFIMWAKEVDWNAISVHIWLGTWCGDSEREVPRFFKVMDESGMGDQIEIKMFAIDREFSAPNMNAAKANVQYVPTFIFYKEDKEVGRIIEKPEKSLERDIIKILQN